MRPCSGAVIVLVFALGEGLFPWGVASSYVMGIGTGLTVAILASLAAGSARTAERMSTAERRWPGRLLKGAEGLAAVAIFAIGAVMLAASLSTGT